MTNDLLFTSLMTQRHALHSRSVTVEALIQAHLDHQARLHPHLNALVYQSREMIIQQARDADKALTHNVDKSRPLLGVPITVKDSWDVAGMVSTAGTLGRKGYVPDTDAVCVRRLRDAGAIIMGKTNCSEIVLPFETDNLVYGRTNNPWDLSRTPGGSTGGEAALIAAGGSSLGLATDAAASIRAPAHFCGIAGIKPTTGRIPRTGHFPRMGGISGNLSACGIMARTVDDLITVLPLLCGPDGVDPDCHPVPYYDPHDVTIADLRVFCLQSNEILTPHDDIVTTLATVATLLREHRAIVNEDTMDWRPMLPIFEALFGADGGMRIRQFLDRIGTHTISPALENALDRFEEMRLSAAALMSHLGRLDGWRSMLLKLFRDYDVMLLPVSPHVAPPHGALLGADGNKRISYTAGINMAGLPSASVPVGLNKEGLPVGVQIVAAPWREDIVLAVARTIEQGLGGYQKPPMPFLSE